MSNGAVSRGMGLAEFDLRTQHRDAGYGPSAARLYWPAALRLEKGAPPEVRAAFTALARFAEFSGTGAQTTYSFGPNAVSFLPAPPKEPPEEITTAPGDRPL